MTAFNPKPNGTVTRTVNTGSQRVQFRPNDGTAGGQVQIANMGAYTAYVASGDSNITALVPSASVGGGLPVPPGMTVVYTLAGNYLAAICDSGGSTTLAITDGVGEGMAAAAGALGASGAASTPVLGAGENHVGEVSGHIAIVGGTLTRPADNASYGAFEIISNSVTAASCVPITLAAARVIDGSCMLRRARLKVNDVTPWTNAVVRAHFFKDSPVVDTTGDNGVFAGHVTESNYLGGVDITLGNVFSDFVKGLGVPVTGSEINFTPASGTVNIFAMLEARTAITTPGSAKVFSLVTEIHQN